MSIIIYFLPFPKTFAEAYSGNLCLFSTSFLMSNTASSLAFNKKSSISQITICFTTPIFSFPLKDKLILFLTKASSVFQYFPDKTTYACISQPGSAPMRDWGLLFQQSGMPFQGSRGNNYQECHFKDLEGTVHSKTTKDQQDNSTV